MSWGRAGWALARPACELPAVHASCPCPRRNAPRQAKCAVPGGNSYGVRAGTGSRSGILVREIAYGARVGRAILPPPNIWNSRSCSGFSRHKTNLGSEMSNQSTLSRQVIRVQRGTEPTFVADSIDHQMPVIPGAHATVAIKLVNKDVPKAQGLPEARHQCPSRVVPARTQYSASHQQKPQSPSCRTARSGAIVNGLPASSRRWCEVRVSAARKLLDGIR